jgi:uncharacterized membrane protein YdbT with pleckstrin-like domain
MTMGYVESNLASGERIVHRGELHWAIFLPGIVLLPIIIGILFLIAAILAKISTEMAVTNKRVIIKSGLISRRTIEMNLSKIETVGVDQGILGRMLNYGTVTVKGTGGTGEPFKWVSAPLDFRRAVQAQSPA